MPDTVSTQEDQSQNNESVNAESEESMIITKIMWKIIQVTLHLGTDVTHFTLFASTSMQVIIKQKPAPFPISPEGYVMCLLK